MPAKRLTKTELLTYPVIFNPVPWIIIAFLIFVLLLFSWIGLEKTNGKWNFRITAARFRDFRDDVFVSTLLIIINTFWISKRKTLAYCRYLKSSCLSPYPFNDWRSQQRIKADYEQYLQYKRQG